MRRIMFEVSIGLAKKIVEYPDSTTDREIKRDLSIWASEQVCEYWEELEAASDDEG